MNAAESNIGIERTRELVKTMYALSYTKASHAKPSKVMLRMDQEQQELYRLVNEWVARDLGNA